MGRPALQPGLQLGSLRGFCWGFCDRHMCWGLHLAEGVCEDQC